MMSFDKKYAQKTDKKNTELRKFMKKNFPPLRDFRDLKVLGFLNFRNSVILFELKK